MTAYMINYVDQQRGTMHTFTVEADKMSHALARFHEDVGDMRVSRVWVDVTPPALAFHAARAQEARGDVAGQAPLESGVAAVIDPHVVTPLPALFYVDGERGIRLDDENLPMLTARERVLIDALLGHARVRVAECR